MPTANRRLMMAQAMNNASSDRDVMSNNKDPAQQHPGGVRLEGYTGPDALAREKEKTDRIKAKAMKSLNRELGTDAGISQQTMGLAVSDASYDSSSGSEDDSSAYSENAPGPTNFHDIQDPQLKRLASKLLKKLNHDPWDEFKKYSDPDVREFLERHPETASIMYDFTHFSGYIFPLSMLCTLGASPQTIEQAYKAYKPAIDECDVWIGTPLHYACSYKAKSNVVSVLISKQPAMLQRTNQFGRTPLHTACLFKGSTKMVSVLLQKFPRAAVIPEKDGYTPLHLACENGAHSEIVKMLASSNPETCLAQTTKGSSPLDLAHLHNANQTVIDILTQMCVVLAEKDHNSSQEGMSTDEDSADSASDDGRNIRDIARATQERRLRAAEANNAKQADLSDGGADIRAIARQTALRRLQMAEQADYCDPTQDATTARLPGYTGPDALAEQMSRMEKIKSRAVASAGRELGANTAQLASTVGVNFPMEQQNPYHEDDSIGTSGSDDDYGSDSDYSSEDESGSDDESGTESEREEEIDIRAIARKTEQRRLQMAMAMSQGPETVQNHDASHVHSTVRLEGYTGPDALARETSKMDKIKAKAIQTASRELGTCPTALERAVGVKKEQENEASPQREGATDLADALGLSSSFFDATTNKTRNQEHVEGKGRSLFANVLQRVEDGTQSVEAAASTETSEGPRDTSSPNKFSLAEALGMKVDPNNGAPLVGDSSPQTKKSFMVAMMARVASGENTDSDSEDSSTQYTEDTDAAHRPQANSLAMALGMKVGSHESAPTIKNSDKPPRAKPESKKNFMQTVMANASLDSDSEESSSEYTEETETARPQANSLAAALGMKVDSNATAVPFRETGNGPVSLPQSKKSFMQTVMARAASGESSDSDSEESSTQYTEESNQASKPQANSLAMALGMRIDPNDSAPTIRKSGKTPKSIPQSKIGFMQAVMARAAHTKDSSDSDSESSSTQNTGNSSKAYMPQSNSLAMALGMKVDPNTTAPHIRESDNGARAMPESKKSFMQAVMANTANESDSEESSKEYTEQSDPAQKPQPNSLAMALGMKVDPSTRAPPMRESGNGSNASMPHSKKSFIQAVMANASLDSESEESSTQYTEETDPTHRPQANSLAMALGMKVDPKIAAPPIRESSNFPSDVRSVPTPTSKQSFMQAVMARAAADDISDSEESNTEYTEETDPAHRPQVNSLAMALGMKVDPKISAPPMRESSDNGLRSQWAASSLPHSKKSFMQTVMANASLESDSEASSTEYTEDTETARPQANSLAAALGMKVDLDANAVPIKGSYKVSTPEISAFVPSNTRSFMQAVMARSAIDSGSKDSTTEYTEETDPAERPQPNSLAMALGMKSFMQAVMANASIDSDSEESSSEYTEMSNPAQRPQANSLAMALGMKVDPHSRAPPVRESSHGARAMPQSKNSFMQAVMANASLDSDSEESSTGYTEETETARPQANSLAMALGMKVDPNTRALPVRMSGFKAMPQSKNSFMEQVVMRSQVEDSDSSGTDVTDNLTEAARAGQTNFLTAVIGRAAYDVDIDSESDVGTTEASMDESQYAPNVLPQPKSLADALEMRVDPTSTAPMIRTGKIDPTVAAKMSRTEDGRLAETVIQRGSTDDISVSEVTELDYDDVDISVSYQGTPSGLVSENGRKSFLATIMERVSLSSDIERSDVSSESSYQQSETGAPAVLPQPNSLAAALSMRINPVSTASPILELRSPLPPPAEPDDADDADFASNEPGVPYNLMSEFPALESMDTNENIKDSTSDQLLHSLSTDIADVRSEMKSLIEGFASTTKDVEHLKEGSSGFESALESLQSFQTDTSNRIAQEEERANTAEAGLIVRLSKTKDELDALNKVVTASKSDLGSRLSQQEASTVKLAENVEQVQTTVSEQIEGKLTEHAKLSVQELEDFKQQMASIASDLEATKSSQALKTTELLEAEADVRQKEIEQQLGALSKQYSEGLSSLVEKVFLSSKWIDATGKFDRALSEIQESRALLGKEHEDVQALKQAVDDHFAKLQDSDDSTTSFVSEVSEKGEGHTSEVLKSIQMRMRQERLRQKALRNQLKARALQFETPSPSRKMADESPFDENDGEGEAKERAAKATEAPAEDTALVEKEDIAERVVVASDESEKTAQETVANDSDRDTKEPAKEEGATVDEPTVDEPTVQDACEKEVDALVSSAPVIEETLNESVAITEDTADITDDHSRKLSAEGGDQKEDHEKLSTVGEVNSSPLVEETPEESIKIEEDAPEEEDKASKKVSPVTPATAAETSDPSPTPRTLEGAVGMESQPLSESQQMQMEMNLLRDQVQDIVSIMSELRQEIAARKVTEEASNSDKDVADVETKNAMMDYNKLLFTLLGLILLSSTVAFRLSAMGVQDGGVLQHIQTQDLEQELEAATKTLESDDAAACAARPVDEEDDSSSVATAPANGTIAAYFGDDASLSRLDSPVKEASTDNRDQVENDDSLSGDFAMEQEEELDMEEVKVDGLDVLVPSSASLVEPVEEDLEAPTITKEDESPAMLPPTLAVIHRFTRPVKDTLGFRLNKEARQKMVEN
ncbi:MAG: hypothetical protein SGILL_001769, partial [Bacillariaceae sp.]